MLQKAEDIVSCFNQRIDPSAMKNSESMEQWT